MLALIEDGSAARRAGCAAAPACAHASEIAAGLERDYSEIVSAAERLAREPRVHVACMKQGRLERVRQMRSMRPRSINGAESAAAHTHASESATCQMSLKGVGRIL